MKHNISKLKMSLGTNLYRWQVGLSGLPVEIHFFVQDPEVRKILGRWWPCPNVCVATALRLAARQVVPA